MRSGADAAVGVGIRRTIGVGIAIAVGIGEIRRRGDRELAFTLWLLAHFLVLLVVSFAPAFQQGYLALYHVHITHILLCVNGQHIYSQLHFLQKALTVGYGPVLTETAFLGLCVIRSPDAVSPCDVYVHIPQNIPDGITDFLDEP